MNDLELIRRFRAEVPAPDDERAAAARVRLMSEVRAADVATASRSDRSDWALAGAGDLEPWDSVRGRVLHAARARAAAGGRVPVFWLRRPFALAAVGAATAAAVAALLTAGSSSLTGEASAAAILRAAVAQAPAAGEVAHYDYGFTVTVAGHAISGTSDVWSDPTASPARSSQTVRLDKGPQGGAPMLLGRFIDLGGAIFGYDATHDAMTLPSASNAAPSIALPNESFDGPQVAAALQAAGSQVSALPEQTLDGITVDPVRAVGVLGRPGLQVTFYFNHVTHGLQGFDAASADASYPGPAWQVRLRTATVVSAAQAPADAFSLAGLSAPRVADRPNKDGTSPDTAAIRTALAAGVITPAQAAAIKTQLAAELQALAAGKPSGLG